MFNGNKPWMVAYEILQGQLQDVYKEIGALTAWRRRYSSQLGRLKDELMTIREDIANLRKEVDDTKTVSAGAAAAIAGVSQLVKDLQDQISNNPDMTTEEISAALGEMAGELDASQQSLGQAIANIPASAGGVGGQTAAERAAAEGNATLQQPNSPTG